MKKQRSKLTPSYITSFFGNNIPYGKNDFYLIQFEKTNQSCL
jgi:hypothetical protein